MGPNGAGKSTLLSLAALIARPTRGELLFDGEPAAPRHRGGIGLVAHQPLVYPELTARENLTFFARLHALPDGVARVRMQIEDLGLEGCADRPARTYSRGQLQRLALARALLAAPSLLLLDEPANGLDAAALDRVATVLDRHRDRGGAALIVTHEPELAARVASRLVLLDGGRIVADERLADTPDGTALRERYRSLCRGGAS